MTTLVWLRLDLDDNPALAAAVERGGAVIPVFVWSPDEEAPWAPCARRGPAAAALRELARATGARRVVWNRRVEPAARARERRVQAALGAAAEADWYAVNGYAGQKQVVDRQQRHDLQLVRARRRRPPRRGVYYAPMKMKRLLAALLLTSCATSSSPSSSPSLSPFSSPSPASPKPSPNAAAIASALAAPDRSADDRALDGGRHPAEMLALSGVGPGQTVAELFAGGGYTTELLARVVGSSGHVYGQNNKLVLERFAAKPWGDRLAKPVMANVTRVDRELEDPLPPEAQNLDAVFLVLVYHDTVWQGVDRARMNAAVLRALRPGGVYLIVDHSARAGSGTADTQTLHRIDEEVVKTEVQQAGFKLAAEGDFLRNPADPRDWNASPRAAAEKRGTSDRFVLRFVKP